jgi:hypothetical protein
MAAVTTAGLAAREPVQMTCLRCAAAWESRAAHRSSARCPACGTQRRVSRPPPGPVRRGKVTEHTLWEIDALPGREPEPGEAPDTATASLLGGLIAEVPFRSPDWEEEAAALAVLAVRRHGLRHPCASTPRAPGCTHPLHERDVALVRGDLEKLGLPGTIELVPLADAMRRATLGDRYQG